MTNAGNANLNVRKPWLLELLQRDSGAAHGVTGTTSREIWVSAVLAGVITDEACVELVASHFRLERADLSAITKQTLRLLPEATARRYGIIPVGETDRQIYIATSDPMNVGAEQAVAFSSGRNPVFRIASPAAIDEAIGRHYGADKRGLSGLAPAKEKPAASPIQKYVIDKRTDTAPGIALANDILRDAIRLGVSDIHIEPGTDNGIVRFRVDGVMRPHATIDTQDLIQVVSRLKIIARLDIATKHKPQDGRTSVSMDGRNYDLRLSTVPIRGFEKAVIRLLNPDSAKKLDAVGLPEPEVNRLRQLLSNRDGIVLITGPTGSGKTTTLYSAISELTTGKINIRFDSPARENGASISNDTAPAFANDKASSKKIFRLPGRGCMKITPANGGCLPAGTTR